jgi:peptidyl-prolyl cis-trans isomerase SurA
MMIHRSDTIRQKLAPAAAALALAALALAPPATAQQEPPVASLPGLVVTTTPPPAPQAGPPPSIPGLIVTSPQGPVAAPATPPPAPPAAAAKPKPKPKPAVRQASADPGAANRAAAPTGIAALVNDEPITAFEVERRAQFMALSANIQDRARANLKAIAENPATNERLKAILDETIKSNPGKSREQIIAAFEERKKAFVLSLQQQAIASAKASMVPTFRKKALEELIEERLKLQEAKKLSIAVGDDDVERTFKGTAERNKMTPEQFMAFIRQQGADPGVMKDRFRAGMAWRDVIRKRFGHQISVSTREVDRVVASAGAAGVDQVELQLQRITFALPGKIDQKIMGQRYADAEALRARFVGCKSTAALVKDSAAAKFEDLGYRRASSVPEPTRTVLLSARDGEMVPATLAAAGVELYAVCARRTQKASEEKRQAAENELQMKEFERLAQRHLHDLRKDALIEIR